MIEILICDDDKYFCGYMENCILDWAFKNQREVNIEQCYSGKSLRQFIKKERPYLLFLDIELGDETGIQIGDYIREGLKDENLQIVFVSSHTQYAMQLFHIRPFDFLVKPIRTEQLAQVLSSYHAVKLKDNKKYFIYQQKKHTLRMDLNNIMYYQSDRKKVKIFTENRQMGRQDLLYGGEPEQYIEFYGNLEDAMQQLEQRQFWRIHKSYIVNVDYIKSFGRDHFLLKHDIEIPVSRSRWKEVQQWILQHEYAQHPI
ncbi:LytR/AlgR family response regulator transcription factor [Clostridium porci]|uniref:Stage 0 sporulation protein A homolog n=1 Tax=Clostridium porci TaxID=2605778 RepID=A0A7X2TF66_9CLOT|nr:LytTR family DNA-binding domain-containing protein [Clostridium porci]MSS38621.1 response regulator transcription factor [Clostridium porci]